MATLEVAVIVQWDKWFFLLSSPFFFFFFSFCCRWFVSVFFYWLGIVKNVCYWGLGVCTELGKLFKYCLMKPYFSTAFLSLLVQNLHHGISLSNQLVLPLHSTGPIKDSISDSWICVDNWALSLLSCKWTQDRSNTGNRENDASLFLVQSRGCSNPEPWRDRRHGCYFIH